MKPAKLSKVSRDSMHVRANIEGWFLSSICLTEFTIFVGFQYWLLWRKQRRKQCEYGFFCLLSARGETVLLCHIILLMFYKDLTFYHLIIVSPRYPSDTLISIWMFLVEYIYLYSVGIITIVTRCHLCPNIIMRGL